MKKTYVLLLYLAISSGGFKHLQSMNCLKKLLLKKTQKDLIDKLGKAMVKKENKKIVSLFEKHPRLFVTRKLLEEAALNGSERQVLFPGYLLPVWEGSGIFWGYDAGAMQKIILRMNKETVLDLSILKEIICLNQPHFLKQFLGQYKQYGGDITNCYPCRYPRESLRNTHHFNCGKWDSGDFVIAACNSRVLTLNSANKMLNDLFKYGLRASARFKRPHFEFQEKNLFEAYFYKEDYSEVISTQLMKETENNEKTVGNIAKLLTAIQFGSFKDVKMCQKKVKNRYLGQDSPFNGIDSPIGFAMRMNKEKIVAYLLNYYLPHGTPYERGRLLDISLCCNFPWCTEIFLNYNTVIEKKALKLILSGKKVYYTNVVHKAIKKYKKQGGTFEKLLYKSIFNFALGRVQNQKLIHFLKEEKVLSEIAASSFKEGLDLAEISGRDIYYKFQSIFPYLNDKDVIDMAAVALSSLNVQMLEYFEKKGVNLHQAVAYLRMNGEKELGGVIDEKLLKREELAKFYQKRYNSVVSGFRLNPVLKIMNKYLTKRSERGFSFENCLKTKKALTKKVFFTNRKNLIKFADLEVLISADLGK